MSMVGLNNVAACCLFIVCWYAVIDWLWCSPIKTRFWILESELGN
jgi:hypothetical protein